MVPSYRLETFVAALPHNCATVNLRWTGRYAYFLEANQGPNNCVTRKTWIINDWKMRYGDLLDPY
jgi:hypothetical protein